MLTLNEETSNFTPLGNYVLTVTATSGTLSHSTSATFTVAPPPYLIIDANPTILNITGGSTQTSSVTIVSVNGLSGFFSLTSTLFIPPAVPGLSIRIDPPVVFLPADQVASAILTVSTTNSTPGGSYILTLGSNSTSPFSLHTDLTINVIAPTTPSFGLAFQQQSITIFQNSFGSATFGFFSINGYTNNVALSGAVYPSVKDGPVLGQLKSFKVSPGEGLFSNMNILTNTGTPALQYTVTLTAVHGSLTTSANVRLNVLPVTMPFYSGSGLTWSNKVSLSVNSCQTWVAQVSNPNNSTAVWVNIDMQISGVRVDSGTILIQGGEIRTIMISYDFAGFAGFVLPIKLSFRASIQAGLDPLALSPLNPYLPPSTVITGSFQIVT